MLMISDKTKIIDDIKKLKNKYLALLFIIFNNK